MRFEDDSMPDLKRMNDILCNFVNITIGSGILQKIISNMFLLVDYETIIIWALNYIIIWSYNLDVCLTTRLFISNYII